MEDVLQNPPNKLINVPIFVVGLLLRSGQPEQFLALGPMAPLRRLRFRQRSGLPLRSRPIPSLQPKKTNETVVFHS